MARKSTRRSGKAAAAEAGAAPPPERDPVDAALELAASRGWRHVTLGQVAAAAGLSLSELYARYPSKAALLAGFMDRIDAAMLSAPGEDGDGESARDRLFEVIMRRLDALTPYREAVRSILREAPADPAMLLAWPGARARQSLSWMLEAAGIDSGGLAGLARQQGLALIYLDTLRVWLGDESADLARTMAALDRRLRQAERLLLLLGRGPRASRSRESD